MIDYFNIFYKKYYITDVNVTMNNFKRCIQEDSDSEDDNICDFNLIINKYHDLNDNRQLIVQNDNDIVIERKYKPMIEYPECLIYDDGKIFNNET